MSSSRSALVSPSVRLPASRSACAIQLRIVCSEGSNCAAISGIGRPARASSTILLRNSAGYGGLDLGIVNTSRSKDRVSTKPRNRVSQYSAAVRQRHCGRAVNQIAPATTSGPNRLDKDHDREQL